MIIPTRKPLQRSSTKNSKLLTSYSFVYKTSHLLYLFPKLFRTFPAASQNFTIRRPVLYHLGAITSPSDVHYFSIRGQYFTIHSQYFTIWGQYFSIHSQFFTIRGQYFKYFLLRFYSRNSPDWKRIMTYQKNCAKLYQWAQFFRLWKLWMMNMTYM